MSSTWSILPSSCCLENISLAFSSQGNLTSYPPPGSRMTHCVVLCMCLCCVVLTHTPVCGRFLPAYMQGKNKEDRNFIYSYSFLPVLQRTTWILDHIRCITNLFVINYGNSINLLFHLCEWFSHCSIKKSLCMSTQYRTFFFVLAPDIICLTNSYVA